MTGRRRGGALTEASPQPGRYKALASIQHQMDPLGVKTFHKQKKQSMHF